MSSAHILVQYVDNAAIVECLDTKLSDEMTIQQWSDEIIGALSTCAVANRFIVSFRNVKFMSSSALRALISLKAKTDEAKVTLFLCNINPSNLEVFKITKLDSLFRITPSEIEAQRALIDNKF